MGESYGIPMGILWESFSVLVGSPLGILLESDGHPTGSYGLLWEFAMTFGRTHTGVVQDSYRHQLGVLL